MFDVADDWLACAADYLEDMLTEPVAGREREWALHLDRALSWVEMALGGSRDGPARRLLDDAGALRAAATPGICAGGPDRYYRHLRRRGVALLASLHRYRGEGTHAAPGAGHP